MDLSLLSTFPSFQCALEVIGIRCSGITEISAKFTGGEAEILKKYLYIHIDKDISVYL